MPLRVGLRSSVLREVRLFPLDAGRPRPPPPVVRRTAHSSGRARPRNDRGRRAARAGPALRSPARRDGRRNGPAPASPYPDRPPSDWRPRRPRLGTPATRCSTAACGPPLALGHPRLGTTLAGRRAQVGPPGRPMPAARWIARFAPRSAVARSRSGRLGALVWSRRGLRGGSSTAFLSLEGVSATGADSVRIRSETR